MSLCTRDSTLTCRQSRDATRIHLNLTGFFALNDDVRTPLSYELQKDLKFSVESSGFNLHTDMFESFLSLQIQTLLRNSMRCRDVFVPICFIPPSIRDEAGRPTASITSRLLLLILSQDEELKQ